MRTLKKFSVCVLLILTTLFVQESHGGVHQIPPVVRVVCFQSADIDKPTADDLQFYTTVIMHTQKYYQNEMIRHGYGSKTFTIDRKENGQVNIVVVRGTKKLRAYTTWEILVDDFPNKDRLIQGDHDNIQVIFLLGASFFEGLDGLQIRTCWGNDCLHNAVIPTAVTVKMFRVTAHELGHCFWLDHNPREGLLMHRFGVVDADNPQKIGPLSAEEAALLDKHRYFVQIPVIEEKDAAIELSNPLPVLWGNLKAR
ncbi:MAG: hypothetical protein OXC79_09945 [Candidatus Poribacteria bacterium]|nr:hypothetical protein [Candidatus Poribacteria bacterium]